jgi:hypothetical protein
MREKNRVQFSKTKLATLALVSLLSFSVIVIYAVTQTMISNYGSLLAITFSNAGITSTVPSEPCTFYVYCTALSGNLSHFIFGTNNTGSWVNDTAVAFAKGVTSAWANITKILNSTANMKVQWNVWANNTDNAWSALGTQTLTISASSLIEAKSGSVRDIQDAIDYAISIGAAGVQIPAGNWLFDANGNTHVSFNVPSNGFKIQGMGINETILHLADANESSASTTIMFQITGTSGGMLEITGITFRGRGDSNVNIGAGDVGIAVVSCRDFRIHHCRFDGKLGRDGIQVVAISWMGGNEAFGCRGVIDHCQFADIFVAKAFDRNTGWQYGVYVGWYAGFNPDLWVDDVWDVAGKYDDLNFSIYVEDCTFSEVRHAIVCEHGGVWVFRHNNVTSISDYYTSGSVDHHPYRSYGDGSRWGEAYENILMDEGLWIGSGGGLWFNNTINSRQHAYSIIQGETSDPNCYPRCAVQDVYIWNNTVINAPGGAWYISNQGRIDPVYYTRAPSAEQGEVDYEPYPYPHPLTLSGMSSQYSNLGFNTTQAGSDYTFNSLTLLATGSPTSFSYNKVAKLLMFDITFGNDKRQSVVNWETSASAISLNEIWPSILLTYQKVGIATCTAVQLMLRGKIPRVIWKNLAVLIHNIGKNFGPKSHFFVQHLVDMF